MEIRDIASVVLAIIGSIGGGGLIVLGMSNWLGKVWAQRLMDREQHRHEKELEELRTNLSHDSKQMLTKFQSELEVTRATAIRDNADKVAIYRASIDLLAKMIAKIEMIIQEKRGLLTPQEELEFEEQRLKIYAYLAMHAPQSVMSAHDDMTDMLLDVMEGKSMPTWPQVRDAALKFLNEMRADIGVNPSPIEYCGTR